MKRSHGGDSSAAGNRNGDGGEVSNQGGEHVATEAVVAGATSPYDHPSSSAGSAPTNNDKHSIAWLKSRMESKKTAESSSAMAMSSSSTTATEALLVKELNDLSLQDVENITPKEGEVLWAAHLNRLSRDEREQILQDIHGVAPVPIETPGFVNDALTKMGNHIDQLLNEYHYKRQVQEQSSKKNRTYQHPKSTSSTSNDRHASDDDNDDDGGLHPYEIALKGNGNQGSQQRDNASLPPPPPSSSSTSYFASDKFRIRFLRAERFEPKKSAERFLRYFEQKLYLFGRRLLPKHLIGASDLNDTAFNFLLAGHVQLLPDRDRAGRAVVIGNRTSWQIMSGLLDFLQAVWVVMSAALEDEEIQRKGFVYIYYGIDAKFLPDRKLMKEGAFLGRSLPLRIDATHVCTNSAKIQAAMSVVTLLTGNFLLRLRCHKGSQMECFYSLGQFGIRVDTIMIDSVTGDIDTKKHATYWEKKRQSELAGMHQDNDNSKADMETFDIVDMTENDHDFDLLGLDIEDSDGKGIKSFDCEWDRSQSTLPNPQSSAVDSLPRLPSWKSSPGPGDILLGRGKSIQNHPGNIRYRAIIEKNLARFESATRRGAKAELVKDVLQQVFSSGANFWQLDKSSQNKKWTPVDEKTACEKISHSFRNAKTTVLNRTSSSGGSIEGSSISESATSHPQQKKSSTGSGRIQKRPRREDLQS